VNPSKRRIEFPHHFAEWGRQRGPPADEHVVMAGAQLAGRSGRRHAHHLPQSPAYPVTLYGIADLARHGEADADGTFVTARARLQHESAARGSLAARCGPKIAAAPQPLDDDGTGPITH
jgi:hypothetical protein